MFIGDKEIDKVENFTVDGSRVNISFKDGSSAIMSKLLYDVSVSDSEVDASTLRDNQMFAVVKEILKVLLLWDINTGDVEYAMSLTQTSLAEWAKAADIKKWGKPRNKVTISELDNVLKNG